MPTSLLVAIVLVSGLVVVAVLILVNWPGLIQTELVVLEAEQAANRSGDIHAAFVRLQEIRSPAFAQKLAGELE